MACRMAVGMFATESHGGLHFRMFGAQAMIDEGPRVCSNNRRLAVWLDFA